MTQELERQNLRSASGSVSSEGSTSRAKQIEVMSKILGSRSDYQIGVGYRPKSVGKSSTSTSSANRSTQSRVLPTLPPQVMGILGEMWAGLRDKVEGREIDLHDPRYEGVLQYLSSGTNQGTWTSSMPHQPQQNSPNLSAGSSQFPNLSQFFGLSSQSPPVDQADQVGGFHAPTVSQMAGLSQQAAYYPSPPVPQQDQTPLVPQPRPQTRQEGSRGFNLEFDFFNEASDQENNN